MKKIKFADHILPHLVAVGAFFLVTVFFFNPIFFNNKTLLQHDIEEFKGSAKSIMDYREKTGEEALWADAMFSGMPAYLVSVQWNNRPITWLKTFMAVGLPHPIANIFLAFLCYYIMLLAFRIRPYLAIAGAIAFGLSSYVIIGLTAGHNGRIGAIAFMPLIMAGIHLAFSNKKILGAALTATGLALHLRENHVQMTYYFMLIVLIYGVIQLTESIKDKTLPALFKTVGILFIAAVIGAGTFFGQFWAISEYTPYTTRGKSDLANATPQQSTEDALGMGKNYAFEFSNGILEPLTLMIPNIYGGSSSNFLFLDQKSESYKALVRSGNQQTANQLANYTGSYWGEQRLSAPYYAGAIIVFLFAVGIAFAPKKYMWWLVCSGILGIVLSWGSNFATFNYMMFDYFPGYNKFRSVTFALIMVLFAMPLLGMLGLERVLANELDKTAKRKLLIAFAATGGVCLLLWLFAGMFSFTREVEAELPDWFLNALSADRKSLLRSDAFRSFTFMLLAFLALYFNVHKKISATGFYAFMILIVTIDLAVVDKRFISDDNFKRKRDNSSFALTAADQEILKDKSYYRVYNISGLVSGRNNPFAEATTSYSHYSIGGYHAAKMRRYSDFYDSCIVSQTRQFFAMAQQGNPDFSSLSGFNMLNIKYVMYGPERDNVIVNNSANGNAWFVEGVVQVKSPAEELARTCAANTKTTAVVDGTRFSVSNLSGDSAASITLREHTPRYLKYESQSSVNGLAVFSEIYYPHGWIATIDGKESKIIRADYILRALEVPRGKHTIEFKFEPKPYVIGNKVTAAFSWVVLLLLLGSIAFTFRKQKAQGIS